MPSLHVMGEADDIITTERSDALCRCFAAEHADTALRTVLRHEGGHLIPSFAPVRHAFKAFFRDRRDNV